MQDDLVGQITTPEGQAVYTVKGMLTASLRAPEVEARRWVSGKNFTPDTLIVGGGSGYHLNILSDIYGASFNCYVLEPQPHLKELLKNKYPCFRFLSVDELREDRSLQLSIERFYIFRSALQWIPELPRNVTSLFREVSNHQTIFEKDALSEILKEFVK